MEKNQETDYQLLIDGRYSLFHKILSFSEFVFKALISMTSEIGLKFEEFASIIKELYSKTQKTEFLDFFNNELIKNSKLINLLKIDENAFLDEAKLLQLYKENTIKIKVLGDFFKENSYEMILFIPFSHPLKENYYKTVLLTNNYEDILKSVKFIKKSSFNENEFQISTNKKPIFISHKLSIFHNFQKALSHAFLFYYHNHFYHATTKEKLEKNPVFSIDYELDLLNLIPSAISFLKEKVLKSNEMKPIRIGYFLLCKKIEDMCVKQMIRATWPLEFIPIDLRYPIINNNYDMVIHKITDLIKYYGSGEESSRLQENFKQFYEKYKETIIFIDGLEGIQVVLSRVIFQEFFEKLFLNGDFLKKMEVLGINSKIKVPKIIEIDRNMDYHLIVEKMKKSQVNFPVILKTKVALGEQKTHYMAVGLNYEGLEVIEKHENFRKEEHIIQEFVNHNETIFKIYVIGEKSHYYTRQSLPNMTKEILGDNQFFFDSQIPFKDQLEYLKHKKDDFTEQNVKIDERIFDIMTETISEKLGFSLYGYDLIKDCENGDVHVVDINYFPGFKFQGDLQKLFKEFFMNKLKKKN